MTNKINLNTNPYYDDFDESKNYHQILFKPDMAVQARELTQIQSILKNQIQKFGNHIFQHGSVVIPGNSRFDLNVPYAKIESSYSGTTINQNYFNGQIIVGVTSGVRAIVNIIESATDTEPLTFYLAYIRGGETLGVANGKTVFDAGEDLYLLNNPTVLCKIQSGTSSIGVGSIAYMNSGVYYINGTFVSTDKQYTIISKYTSTPNCRVVFKINEEIVTSDDDETLLDPAQGVNNYSAPGANRYKISLTFTNIALNSGITSDYVELMRFEDGELVAHSLNPKYSELEKSLAARTFDESGNYIVDGLNLSIRESKKTPTNNGVSSNGDLAKFYYEISSGKAYINGYGVQNLVSKRVEIDKARTSSHVKQKKITKPMVWGQYLYVTAPQGTLNIQNKETIQLWNISSATGGTQIGTAKVLGIDYHVGDGSGHTIYKLYVGDLVLTSGSYSDIGSIRLASANFYAKVVHEFFAPVTSGAYASGDTITSGARTATVAFFNATNGMVYVYRHSASNIPRTGDLLTSTGASSVVQNVTSVVSSDYRSLVFPLPDSATKALKDVNNNFDMVYTSWVVLTIPAGSTTTSTVTGTLVPIETGTFIALTTSGVDSGTYTINGSGNAFVRSTSAPAGGITIYAQVVKQNASPRTKSIQTHTGTYTAGSKITLSHADVFKITSIVSSGVDIGSRYRLNNGQTDYEYGISSVELKTGFTVPSGSVDITYSYFSHTTGDFFSIDSYPNSLLSEEIPTYKSPNDGKTYSLRDCIDFRNTIGVANNTVVPDSFITTSVQKYVSRIDVVCLNKNGDLVIVQGTPAETPIAPRVDSALYVLDTVLVPAYTYSLLDVDVERKAVVRFTMSDVNDLKTRLRNLEQYSLLTSAENQAINTPFVDAATGLDRFKTGYLVESMEDPFAVADAGNIGFAATLDTDRKLISCLLEADVIDLTAWSGSIADWSNVGNNASELPENISDYVRRNGMLSIRYTEVPFASVIESSRVLNVNPFNVVAWKGNLKVVPPSDVWIDVFDLPDINITLTETIVNTVINWISPIAATPSPSLPTPSIAVPTQPTETINIPIAQPVVNVPVVAPVQDPPWIHYGGDGLAWTDYGGQVTILDNGTNGSAMKDTGTWY